MVKAERIHVLKDGMHGKGPVIYWMSRDQRANENWALLYAQELAVQESQPLAVVFCLATNFPGAGLRQYDFMIRGLQETEKELSRKNIPFYLLAGEPAELLHGFMGQHKVNTVVTDFDPLRVKRQWKEKLISLTTAKIVEVDAHNIVPCRLAGTKCEFGAYTFRPKLKRYLPSFLEEYPELKPQSQTGTFAIQGIDWIKAWKAVSPDPSVVPVTWLTPGSKAGTEKYRHFLETKLAQYADGRNDPNLDATSGISPYLHFGQISAQSVALQTIRDFPADTRTGSFLEELMVRRELSDNFCFYNPDYDRFTGFHEWARRTLDDHRQDEREFIYTYGDFETSATHDPLWNSAQNEMVKSGRMHGYMRMYWAKKILEWTSSPEEALEVAIRLNDRFQLDGRDPNGYTGCAWSIGGVHDRAWGERPVFGKIRYMNFNGCKRKFDVNRYMEKWK